MRVNPDGTPVQDSPENPNPRCLTCPPPNVVDPLEEERAPGWSPDGQHILFMCRTGGPDFELCTIKADGKDRKQLTNNGIGDLLGPRPWSPDAYPDGKKKFVFHRALGPGVGNQLFVMTLNQDGACQPACAETQLTFPLPPPSPPGLNLIASWGKIRVHVKAPKETQPPPAPQQVRRSQSDEASHDADGDSCRRAVAIGEDRGAGLKGEAKGIVGSCRGLGDMPRGGLTPAAISVPGDSNRDRRASRRCAGTTVALLGSPRAEDRMPANRGVARASTSAIRSRTT